MVQEHFCTIFIKNAKKLEGYFTANLKACIGGIIIFSEILFKQSNVSNVS